MILRRWRYLHLHKFLSKVAPEPRFVTHVFDFWHRKNGDDVFSKRIIWGERIRLGNVSQGTPVVILPAELTFRFDSAVTRPIGRTVFAEPKSQIGRVGDEYLVGSLEQTSSLPSPNVRSLFL